MKQSPQAQDHGDYHRWTKNKQGNSPNMDKVNCAMKHAGTLQPSKSKEFKVSSLQVVTAITHEHPALQQSKLDDDEDDDEDDDNNETSLLKSIDELTLEGFATVHSEQKEREREREKTGTYRSSGAIGGRVFAEILQLLHNPKHKDKNKGENK